MNNGAKKRRLGAGSLLILLILSIGTPLTSKGADRFGKFDTEPSGLAGLGLGYGHQFGKTYQVDAVSGATTQTAEEKPFSEPGLAMAAYGDFGLLQIGPGTAGLRFGMELNVPGPYLSFSAMPRYRLEIYTQGTTITAIAPWAGAGLTFGWMEPFETAVFINVGVSIGMDARIKQTNWYLGGQIDVNAANFKAIENEIWLNGVPQTTVSRWNNVLIKALISYRFY